MRVQIADSYHYRLKSEVNSTRPTPPIMPFQAMLPPTFGSHRDMMKPDEKDISIPQRFPSLTAAAVLCYTSTADLCSPLSL